MKAVKITFLLSFISAVSFAQLSKTEKEYGVTIEVRNNALNEIYKAEKLYENKKYNEAQRILLKVSKADPVILNIYENLYKVSKKLNNNNSEVINCLITGKKIYNDNDEICFFLAEMIALKKDYKSAIVEYNNAINLQLNKKIKSFYFPNYYFSRGFCYIQLSSFSLAEKDYSIFLNLSPKDPLGLLNRGLCYYRLGYIEKAKKDWKMASENGSEDARFFLSKLN